jgi:hypothetical protein
MLQTLVIFLPMLAIGLLTWFFLRSRMPRKKKKIRETHRTRQERAVWAWAKVLNAKRSDSDSLGRVRVEMQLEVHMPGTEAYPATTIWLVEKDSLEYVEEGKEVTLKVDPEGPQYVYPNGPWAKFVE